MEIIREGKYSMPKQTFFNLPEEKRNHIIEVSIDEFAKAPYQNISINHLIKSMNIPTGSFYQYFEDKKDLYFYILSFYIDGILEESIQEDKKFDLLNSDYSVQAMDVFSSVKEKMKNYQEIFIDNFEKAPLQIKRDWTFDVLIGGKYMALYDYSFFDNEQLDPMIKKNKSLLLGMVLAIPNVIRRFCNQEDIQEELKMYQFCIDILKVGFTNFCSDTEKSHNMNKQETNTRER